MGAGRPQLRYLIRAWNLITEAANKSKHVSPVPPRSIPSRETSRHRKIKRNHSLVRLAGGDPNIRSQTARLPQPFPWSNKHRTTARLHPPFWSCRWSCRHSSAGDAHPPETHAQRRGASRSQSQPQACQQLASCSSALEPCSVATLICCINSASLEQDSGSLLGAFLVGIIIHTVCVLPGLAPPS